MCLGCAGLAPGDPDLAPGDPDLVPGNADLVPGNADLAPGDADLAPGDADLVPGDADLAWEVCNARFHEPDVPRGSRGPTRGRLPWPSRAELITDA